MSGSYCLVAGTNLKNFGNIAIFSPDTDKLGKYHRG